MITIAILTLVCRTRRGQLLLFRWSGITPLALRY